MGRVWRVHRKCGGATTTATRRPPSISIHYMDSNRAQRQVGRIPAGTNAIGIVVKNGGEAERRPRAVAFVWGGKVRPTPSLPYGRWKKALSAA